MSDWQFTDKNATVEVVNIDGVNFLKVPQLSKVTDGVRQIHPMFINNGIEEKTILSEFPQKKGYFLRLDRKKYFPVCDVNLFPMPDWGWLCDVPLKPFQEKIAESYRKIEKANQKGKRW